MVMSGSSTDREEEPLDWSFQNHKGELLRRGNHPNSNFRRCILDSADLTEGNFTNSDFTRASMVEADLMKSAFDNCRALQSVTLPSSITTISESAFKDCEKLEE